MFGLSERRSCRLLNQNPSTQRYKSRQTRTDVVVRDRMRELASRYRRFGSPRIHTLLKREGLVQNHKRTERLYRLEGLALKRKRPKRKASRIRIPIAPAQEANGCWSMDFVFDRLLNGRKIKCLTIIDDYSKLCPRIEVGHAISGVQLSQILEEMKVLVGVPKIIRVDNGPEFQSKAFWEYCINSGIEIHHIDPGKPTQNAFVESFNGKFRDECLNEECFLNLQDCKNKVETWRIFYNEVRPHSSLKGLTPNEFASQSEFRLTA